MIAEVLLPSVAGWMGSIGSLALVLAGRMGMKGCRISIIITIIMYHMDKRTARIFL